MSALNEDRPRDVVPLWRNYSTTVGKGELASFGRVPNNRFSDDMLNELRSSWESEHGLVIGMEYVAAAHTLGRFGLANEAAKYLLEATGSTSTMKGIAEQYLSKGKVVSHATDDRTESTEVLKARIYSEIATTRKRLIFYPRNAILWCNLALNYTSLGHSEKAERALKVAFSLGNHNRFVIRSTSRFYLHSGNPSKAQGILLASPLLKYDPWILASEIAIAAANGRTSHNIKAARRTLEAQRVPPFHLSELASAIGTIEARSGNIKKARKLVDYSLLEPSENSIAQAAWMFRNIHGVGIESGSTDSHEANAWFSFRTANWRRSYIQAMQWHVQQPFSSRPLLLSSYLSSVVNENYQLSAEISKYGLLANPDDFGLLNALAYALAKSGDIATARVVVGRINSSALTQSQRIVWFATCGLVQFRLGNPEQGRRLYRQAIELGDRYNPEAANMARLYYVLEESFQRSPNADELMKEALEKTSSLKDPNQLLIVERVKLAMSLPKLPPRKETGIQLDSIG